jgi:hypothetical protein
MQLYGSLSFSSAYKETTPRLERMPLCFKWKYREVCVFHVVALTLTTLYKRKEELFPS